MKFVHLADLHIGRKLGEYSLIDDQSFALGEVLKRVCELNPDAVFIAGDVYDKSVPSEEAVSLADDFLTKLCEAVPRVCVISGNHDSQARLSFASRITRRMGLCVSREFAGGLEKADVDGVSVWLLPHIRPREAARFVDGAQDAGQVIQRIVETIPPADRNVIIAHQFFTCSSGVECCDSEIEPIGGLNAVDGGVFDDFKYAALGHLHKPQRVGRECVRYSGSLLKYSFSEINHKKSFVYGEISEAGSDIRLEAIPFKRDVRVITGTLDELLNLPGNPDDYIAAVLTDEVLPIAPASRLSLVCERLVSVAWQPPGREISAFQTVGGEESPRGILSEFFARMNRRDMNDAEKAYIDDLWRSVGEELGK